MSKPNHFSLINVKVFMANFGNAVRYGRRPMDVDEECGMRVHLSAASDTECPFIQALK